MADLARIKDNVRKMAAQNAPIADIDGYIASEGVTVEDVRNFQAAPAAEPVQQQQPDPRSFQEFWLKNNAAKYATPEAAGEQQSAPLAPYEGGTFSAATEGSQAGLLGGYDDELTAGMLAPIDAGISAIQGKGFDIGKAYTEKQQALDAQKASRRAEHPIASLGGEVMGGLALGGSVRGAPASLRAPAPAAPMSISNRVAPYIGRTGASAIEGAGYGALYGSGEAKPGERLEGAKQGALVGATTGAAIERAGRGIANIAGRRQAARLAPPAPGAQQLADDGNKLYETMRASGVVVKPAKIARLKANIGLSLGSTNSDLAPKAFGLKKLADETLSANPGIGELHNFAKSVNRVLRSRLEGEDAHYVGMLKTQVESLIDGMRAGDITGGGPEAFKMWKEADKLWARQKKTDIVEKILATADEEGAGKYTQSGVANAITKEMRALSRSIRKGTTKGFTEEEKVLVRQMARGGSSSRAINLLAKFAPRGVISTAISLSLGGPVGLAAGHIGGRMADSAAVKAANTLRDATARGYIPQLPQLPNQLRPFIPAGVAASTEIGRLLPTSQQR